MLACELIEGNALNPDIEGDQGDVLLDVHEEWLDADELAIRQQNIAQQNQNWNLLPVVLLNDVPLIVNEDDDKVPIEVDIDEIDEEPEEDELRVGG